MLFRSITVLLCNVARTAVFSQRDCDVDKRYALRCSYLLKMLRIIQIDSPFSKSFASETAGRIEPTLFLLHHKKMNTWLLTNHETDDSRCELAVVWECVKADLLHLL